METIEHEPSKDDSEVEITDLHPQSEEQQAEAETPISPQTTSDSLKRIDRRKERIWLNWRFVVIAGLLLLLLVAMFPIFPALRDRWNQLTSSRSAPAVAHVTPTATPIGSPWWSGHNVSLTIVDGVAYVGAADGVVSALRISDGALLWRFMTKGSADGQPPVVNGVVYAISDKQTLFALDASDGALLWRYTHNDGAALVPPQVSNGIVYVIATKFAAYAALAPAAGDARQTSGSRLLLQRSVPVISASSSVYALRASDGTLLWYYLTKVSGG